MIKVLMHITALILVSATATAGYLPPPEKVEYWCYQGCIESDYSNHNECVAFCYGGRRPKAKPVQIQCNDQAETMAAACCSWGENIQGCMPGC